LAAELRPDPQGSLFCSPRPPAGLRRKREGWRDRKGRIARKGDEKGKGRDERKVDR